MKENTGYQNGAARSGYAGGDGRFEDASGASRTSYARGSEYTVGSARSEYTGLAGRTDYPNGTGRSDHAGGFVRDLGEAARNHPLSAALIGMGLVWLFASRTERGAELIRRSGVDRFPDMVQDAWEGASSNVRSGARAVQETAEDGAEEIRKRGDQAMEGMTKAGQRLYRAASGYIDELPERAGDLFDDARDNLTEMFRTHPLAIGLAGAAVGAAIASAFPQTETESEYFGESSELLKQKASEMASEQVQRVADVGRKVADAVTDEAREQGLTPDGVRTAANELKDKVARVSTAAGKSRDQK